MGFEREALSELYASVWGNRSKMQKEFARGAHGEPFILHELALRGTMTPSQLASSLKASSGRISTVLAALEKKGLITRDIDPDDRRIIRVNLTDAGRERSKCDLEEMRSAICWIFSQMGSGARASSLICCRSSRHTWPSAIPALRADPDEVRAAFAERDRRVADHMRTERAKAARSSFFRRLRMTWGTACVPCLSCAASAKRAIHSEYTE